MAFGTSIYGCCRIEKVRLDRKDGIAKVIGTACCVVGASVITLYKGPAIYSPVPPLQRPDSMFVTLGDAKGKNWSLGCIYLIGHCLSWSGWLVLQAPVLKKYPARLSVTSYTCFFGIIQFLVIAGFAERDPQAWMFHSGGELFTILYAVSYACIYRSIFSASKFLLIKVIIKAEKRLKYGTLIYIIFILIEKEKKRNQSNQRSLFLNDFNDLGHGHLVGLWRYVAFYKNI